MWYASSATALAVAPVLEALKLVQMGYAATAMKLFDYPHFLRTIPADDVQVKALRHCSLNIHPSLCKID